ncbi:hypothetical protein BASA81_001725 [Batrachochytrium salamandrivorans]|nr:hypothetical protein BASA81_001725 [Batrachochytrium salamandrivorans]
MNPSPPPPPPRPEPGKLAVQWPPPPPPQLNISQPQLVSATDTSITLEWTCTGGEGEEFKVQYYCVDKLLPSAWTSLPQSTTLTKVTITNLSPETSYCFQIKSRPKLASSLPVQEMSTLFVPQYDSGPSWSKPSPVSAKLTTKSYLAYRREHNLQRLEEYEQSKLQPFPEEAVQGNTVQGIATRSLGLAVAAAKLTGVGGLYLRTVRSAWKLHNAGFSALLFHSDLQHTVLVLLSYLNATAEKIGLSTKDVCVGCYFALWQAKKKRLLAPGLEREEHSMGKLGVLEADCSREEVDLMLQYIPYVALSYRRRTSHIQWVLRNMQGASKRQLVMSNIDSDPFRPSFYVACGNGELLVVIRGTKELDDAVTDGLADVDCTSFGGAYSVHAGMLKAATWIVNEAGIRECVEKLGGTHCLVICGHSLGGGVAILAALLIAQQFPEIHVAVYAFGTPAVVDVKLAEICKGDKSTVINGGVFGNRVRVRNLICHDDLVPRLSLRASREFCEHLKATREQWGPLLAEDWDGFVNRAQTVWAPRQRTARMPVNSNRAGAREEAPREEEEEEEGSEEWLSRNTFDPLQQQGGLERSLITVLVVPGTICHTFPHRGVQRVSLVDYHFVPLRKIQAFQHAVDEHRMDNTMIALRGVVFAQRNATTLQPAPHWESLADHEGDVSEWRVDCRVCAYPVSWLHTSSSEASEIRSTNHCHSCGKICCSACSQTRVPLPHLGIVQSVLVCDLCQFTL